MEFVVKGVGAKIGKIDNESKKFTEVSNPPISEPTHKQDALPNTRKQKATINTLIAEEKKKYECSLIKQPEQKPQTSAQPQEYFYTSSQQKVYQESHAFENSSSYVDYVPTNDVRELKL